MAATAPATLATFKEEPRSCSRPDSTFDDLLVCGISTQLQHEVADFDEHTSETDAVSSGSDLRRTSLNRLGFSASQLADGMKIQDQIAPDRLSRLHTRLSKLLAP